MIIALLEPSAIILPHTLRIPLSSTYPILPSYPMRLTGALCSAARPPPNPPAGDPPGAARPSRSIFAAPVPRASSVAAPGCEYGTPTPRLFSRTLLLLAASSGPGRAGNWPAASPARPFPRRGAPGGKAEDWESVWEFELSYSISLYEVQGNETERLMTSTSQESRQRVGKLGLWTKVLSRRIWKG